MKLWKRLKIWQELKVDEMKNDWDNNQSKSLEQFNIIVKGQDPFRFTKNIELNDGLYENVSFN